MLKNIYIHCYIIMRLNTCYNQDGAGEFYLHIRVFYFSNLNVPSRMLQHTKNIDSQICFTSITPKKKAKTDISVSVKAQFGRNDFILQAKRLSVRAKRPQDLASFKSFFILLSTTKPNDAANQNCLDSGPAFCSCSWLDYEMVKFMCLRDRYNRSLRT